jgi:hypothetical protein
MSSISEQFANIVRIMKKGEFLSDSYLGVLLYKYRRRRNLSRKELAREWGMEEDSLLRVECGYATRDEICFISTKIRE